MYQWAVCHDVGSYIRTGKGGNYGHGVTKYIHNKDLPLQTLQTHQDGGCASRCACIFEKRGYISLFGWHRIA